MRNDPNLFCNYPDSMTLKDVANALGISTTLASRLVREGVIFGVKVGREYRVATTTVMEYLSDRRLPIGASGRNHCVVNVTSNPKRWTSKERCDIVSAAAGDDVSGRKEERNCRRKTN